MGSCLSDTRQSEAKVKSDQVDASLEVEKRKYNSTYRVLLLGTGESGKSTFRANCSMCCNDDCDRIGAISVLHGNVIDTIGILLTKAAAFGIPVDLPEHKSLIEAVLDLYEINRNGDQRLTTDTAKTIDQLWSTDRIQRTFARRSEFYLPDHAEYYMQNVIRFSEFVKPASGEAEKTVLRPDTHENLPSEKDILYARRRTTGILETELNLHKIDLRSAIGSCHKRIPMQCKIVDVGGQRSERRKWVGQFTDVDVILFFVDVSGVDKCLFECETQNTIMESLDTFEGTMDEFGKHFKRLPIILIFNKMDLLYHKIDQGLNIAKVLNPVIQSSHSPESKRSKIHTELHLHSARSATETDQTPEPLYSGRNTPDDLCDDLLKRFKSRVKVALEWPLEALKMSACDRQDVQRVLVTTIKKLAGRLEVESATVST